MKNAVLASLVFSTLTPTALADIRLTFTGLLVNAGAPQPAPFQNSQIGDSVTVIFEVFDTPTGTPAAGTYPCNYAQTSVQVGAIFTALESSTIDCLTINFDAPPIGSDALVVVGDLPGMAGTVEACFLDGFGASMAGFLNQNFGTYDVLAGPGATFGFINILSPNPNGGLTAILEELVIEVSGPATVGTNYCSVLPNSSGSSASITATGSASVAANDLGFRAGPVPTGQPAVFYYGPGQIQSAFGDGLRCVGGGPGQVVRMFPFVTPDAMGFLNATLDNTLPAHAQALPGATLNFQAWFRDPAAAMTGFNLSDGISVTFTP